MLEENRPRKLEINFEIQPILIKEKDKTKFRNIKNIEIEESWKLTHIPRHFTTLFRWFTANH